MPVMLLQHDPIGGRIAAFLAVDDKETKELHKEVPASTGLDIVGTFPVSFEQYSDKLKEAFTVLMGIDDVYGESTMRYLLESFFVAGYKAACKGNESS